MSDDDLNPRRTRNTREAMRRAREYTKREKSVTSRPVPSNRPTFSGEDTVIDERPAPLEQQWPPIVPPVSVEEVRKHIDDARRAGRNFETPMNVSFNAEEERFAVIPEPEEEAPRNQRADQPVAEPVYTPQPVYQELPAVEAEVAERWDDQYAIDEEPEDYALPEIAVAATAGVEPAAETWEDEETVDPADWTSGDWVEQAPWTGDNLLLDPAPPARPKRRGFLGSLLHRREAAARGELRRDGDLDVWENPPATSATWLEPSPWQSDQPELHADPATFDDVRDEPAAPRQHDIFQLPPFPYGSDEEEGEDYLLADSTFGDREREEEDHSIARMPRICETCRYLRPSANGPTCGAVYAQTYRRIIDLQRLSCASSIGAWWLPSDEYWESRVEIAHHGGPTPLLEQYGIRFDDRGPDDDLHTT